MKHISKFYFMKTFLTLFVLFFSSAVYSEEWNLEYLKTFNDSCIESSTEISGIGDAFEYCGCGTNGIYNNFSLDELLEIFESGELESNVTYKKIVSDCNQKLDY